MNDHEDDGAITVEDEGLSRWVSELAALATLSTTWSATDPREIAEGLAAALRRSLPVEFVCVRLHRPAGMVVEVIRSQDGADGKHTVQHMAPLLGQLLEAGADRETRIIPIGDATLRAAIVQIGEAGSSGVLVAGSRLPDFPRETDRQVLDVAAIHVAAALRSQEAEEALHESERRFDQFMRNLPGLAWIKDAEGRYVYANDAAEKAFRVPRAQLYGKKDEEIFPPETAAKFRENDEQAMARPSGYQAVETLLHEDGMLHHSIVSKFTIPGRDSRSTLVGGMAVDITDRMRAEIALHEREEQFRALFEQTSAGVAQTDLAGRFLMVNDRYCQIVSRSREELMGMQLRDVTHADDLPRHVQQFEALVTGGGSDFTIENRYVRADGTTIWVNNSVSLVRDSTGQPQFVLAAVTDITERNRAEKTAREATRQRDAFLAVLGHELRNPLSPMLTALQLMRLRGIEGRELEILEHQVAHMRRLVDDLLDVSRITSGKVHLRMEDVDVADVVARAVDIAAPLVGQRNHQLQVQIPKGVFGVRADVVRLTQIVANLLHNAAKFSDEGSTIAIIATKVDGTIRLSVRDDGIGIAPEMLATIFDDFVQHPEALDRSRGGLGLGLAIVKNLVRQHGGKVSAHSEGPGKGSEFVVELPAVAIAGPISATAGPAQLQWESRHHARILVVDDNRDAAETIHEGLLHHGYHVEVAFDAATALRIAKEFKPAVALLDIGMPVIDGYELAGLLRGLEELNNSVRLVAVTGFGQPSDRERALAAGFDRHLVKPVDLKT
ncbi:MAG TPA: PAS domain S-box protein, partial [Gemmatimonadaceae bacterium]